MVEYWSPTPKIRGSTPLSPVSYSIFTKDYTKTHKLNNKGDKKLQNMALILNTILPDNKRCIFALNDIYGLGYNLAKQVCEQLGISSNIKCKNLNNNQLDRLTRCISQNYLIGDHLKEKISKNKQHFISINSYRGFRYIEKLPCRGQRTHGNAQTARKNNLTSVSSVTRFVSYPPLNKKNKSYLRNSRKKK